MSRLLLDRPFLGLVSAFTRFYPVSYALLPLNSFTPLKLSVNEFKGELAIVRVCRARITPSMYNQPSIKLALGTSVLSRDISWDLCRGFRTLISRFHLLRLRLSGTLVLRMTRWFLV